MKKNERNCIDSSRISSCITCKPVTKLCTELESVIAKLNSIDFYDIMFEVTEEIEQLNKQCVLDGEEEAYEANVDDFIGKYNSQYKRLCIEVTELSKKLYRACGKCGDLNYKVKVILAEAEFVEAKVALDIVVKKFDYLDEDKYLSYYA